MLSQGEVVSYLLRHDLIDPKTVVDGRLTIFDLSRRHQNYRVVCEGAPSYLLKQAHVPERGGAVEHEGMVYRFLQTDTAKKMFGHYLTHCFGYDSEEQILILELVSHARTLREYHAPRGTFSKTLAAKLGKALASLHRLPVPQGSNWTLPGHPPWVLSAHRPDIGFYCDFSQATVELVRILQDNDELCGYLDQIRDGWRCDAPVHNDVRWDNCLVFAAPGKSRATGLKLIDWELAGLGDPCWDVGSVLSEHLGFWLLSIPLSGQTPPADWPDLARYPLARMQPAIGSFFDNYTMASKLNASSRERVLLRSTRFAAARLLQSAIEQLQMSPRLTAFAVLAVQLALNIMRQPERAAVQLLNLPLDAERST